jgi:hypothetical protein
VTQPLAKPTRAGRLVEKAERRKARRTSPVRNASGAAIPKPEVWHDPKYQAWAKQRYDCAIKGKANHVCGPRVVDGKVPVQFAHAEPAGRGLKGSDFYGVVLCADAHHEQTVTSWGDFQTKYDFDRDATARRIFESSPWAGKVEVSW